MDSNKSKPTDINEVWLLDPDQAPLHRMIKEAMLNGTSVVEFSWLEDDLRPDWIFDTDDLDDILGVK